MAIREEVMKDGKVKFTVDYTNRKHGMRKRQSFFDKLSAEKYLADLKYAVEKGQQLPSTENLSGVASSMKGHTLYGAYKACFDHEWKDKVSALKMEAISKQAFAYFGKNELLTNITTKRIRQWSKDMKDGVTRPDKKKASNGTINRKLSWLSKILRFAVEEEMLEHMPIVRRQKETLGVVRVLSVEEETAIIQCLRDHARYNNDCVDIEHAIIISIETGLRASELLRIERKHIIENDFLRVEISKNDRSRVVSLSDRAKRILQIRCETIKGDLLFPYQKEFYRFRWRTVMDTLNIDDLRWHDLRHTYASRLAMSGATVAEIQDNLGHTAVNMSLRYTHLDLDFKRQTKNRSSKFSDAVEDALTQKDAKLRRKR